MSEQTPELSGIVSRLERLEKENRRLKGARVAVLTIASVIVLMGQAQAGRTVEAERFVLKDASGKRRAQLTSIEDNAVLALYGPQGSKQVGISTSIGAGPSGPFMYLTRAEGKSGAELRVESGGRQD